MTWAWSDSVVCKLPFFLLKPTIQATTKLPVTVIVAWSKPADLYRLFWLAWSVLTSKMTLFCSELEVFSTQFLRRKVLQASENADCQWKTNWGRKKKEKCPSLQNMALCLTGPLSAKWHRFASSFSAVLADVISVSVTLLVLTCCHALKCSCSPSVARSAHSEPFSCECAVTWKVEDSLVLFFFFKPGGIYPL